MAVAAADPLVAADYLPHIRFQLPNVEKSIEVSAQVVWLAESNKKAGIRFVDLTVEARNQIATWIASEKPSAQREGLTPAPVQNVVGTTVECVPEETIWRVVPEQDQSFASELSARAASRASELVTPEIHDAIPQPFVEDLPVEEDRCASAAAFRPQMRSRKSESSADRVENFPARPYVFELSGLHVAAVIFLFAGICLAVGLTAGRSPHGSHPQDPEKSSPATDQISQALLSRRAETTPRNSTSPAPDSSVTVAANPPASATAEPHSEISATATLNAPPAEPAAGVAPIGPSAAVTTPAFPDFDKPEASPERMDSRGPITRSAPPHADSQPAHSSKAVVPMRSAPASSASHKVMPATRPAPHLPSPSTILFTGSGDGSKPFRLTLPEKPIAASSSFAISSQLSVLVFPEHALAPGREPARLQAGELVSFVWPRYPKPGERHASPETVKVRTTIGELGQVLDVKRVSGSLALLPAAASAIRLWRFKPTLVNQMPVQAQQDVTIEFRPPQHAARRVNMAAHSPK